MIRTEGTVPPVRQSDNLAQLPDPGFVDGIAPQNIVLQDAVGSFSEFNTTL